MKKGQDAQEHQPEHTMKNLLAVVLLLIIFVSLVGTVLLTTSIQELKAARVASAQQQFQPSGATGMVALTIEPPSTTTERDTP